MDATTSRQGRRIDGRTSPLSIWVIGPDGTTLLRTHTDDIAADGARVVAADPFLLQSGRRVSVRVTVPMVADAGVARCIAVGATIGQVAPADDGAGGRRFGVRLNFDCPLEPFPAPGGYVPAEPVRPPSPGTGAPEPFNM